jgi:hypothetical protein
VENGCTLPSRIRVMHWFNPLSLITALYNRWSKKMDRKAEACAAFRNAFHRELEGL